MVTLQFMVTGPVVKVVDVADGMFSEPFCTVPFAKMAVVPAMVKMPPPRSIVPLVRVKLLMVGLPVTWQVLLPVTIVTLSMLPGMPLGVQLPAVFQSVEIEPFHVYEVWAWANEANSTAIRRSKGLFIGLEFLTGNYLVLVQILLI